MSGVERPGQHSGSDIECVLSNETWSQTAGKHCDLLVQAPSVCNIHHVCHLLQQQTTTKHTLPFTVLFNTATIFGHHWICWEWAAKLCWKLLCNAKFEDLFLLSMVLRKKNSSLWEWVSDGLEDMILLPERIIKIRRTGTWCKRFVCLFVVVIIFKQWIKPNKSGSTGKSRDSSTEGLARKWAADDDNHVYNHNAVGMTTWEHVDDSPTCKHCTFIMQRWNAAKGHSENKYAKINLSNNNNVIGNHHKPKLTSDAVQIMMAIHRLYDRPTRWSTLKYLENYPNYDFCTHQGQCIY